MVQGSNDSGGRNKYHKSHILVIQKCDNDLSHFLVVEDATHVDDL